MEYDKGAEVINVRLLNFLPELLTGKSNIQTGNPIHL